MRRAVYVLTSFFIVASSFALPLRASNGDHGLKVTNWRAPAVAGSGSKKCATRSRCIKSSRSTGAAGVDGESDEVSMAAARRGPSTSLSLKAVASRLRGGDDDDEAMSPMRRKGLFILTYVAYIAIYLARKPLSVVKPVLQEEEGMTSHQLGGIDTALLGAYAVGQLMIGQVGVRRLDTVDESRARCVCLPEWVHRYMYICMREHERLLLLLLLLLLL